MIWYIVKGQIFTVFLSASHISAVTFPGKVEDYVGGKKGEFKIYQLGNGKTLIFEPRSKIDRNFIAFAKGKKYHFNLKTHHPSHKDITLASGVCCSNLRPLHQKKKWQLFECPKSLYLFNKGARPIQVNENTVTDKICLSKGPPIFVDGKLIYDQGRAL